MNLANFRFETDADGVALVTWDMPGRSMNVINNEVIAELEQIVDRIASDAGDQGRGLHVRQGWLRGGRGSDHARRLAGDGIRPPRQGRRRGGGDARLRRRDEATVADLSGGSKPAASPSPRRSTASAWAAASSLRSPATIASSPTRDKARVGLPEIKVGLFPGGGGTQRVARLMPTPDALQMLFKGDQIRPAAAKKMGLVHEVAPVDQIVALAKAWVKANPNAKAPWDDPKFKPPSGKVFSPARHDDLAAGQRHLPPRDLRQLSRGQGDSESRVRRPATADGSRRSCGREQVFRQHPALQGSGGDDPLAVPVDGRAQQGRAPAGQRPADATSRRSACSARA